MKIKKTIGIIFLHVIVIHTLLNIIFLMGANFSHPLYNLLSGLPIYVQIIVLGLVDAASYTLFSFLYARFYQNQKTLYYVLEWVIVIFWLFLLTFYALSYFFSLLLYSKDIMLVYSMVNPWYGVYMYRLPEAGLYSLWWLLSTVFPCIGLYIGVKLGLRNEVVI